MKTRTLFLVIVISMNTLAGLLSSKQIDAIRRKLRTLPGEIVEMDEAAVIETNFGIIIIEFSSFAAPLYAMNFKKLTTVRIAR